jgi:hypothetical protein
MTLLDGGHPGSQPIVAADPDAHTGTDTDEDESDDNGSLYQEQPAVKNGKKRKRKYGA